MILQALNAYYDRKSKSSPNELAPIGFELKEIPFIFEINQDGDLIQIEDTREGSGKKKRARAYLVPQGVKKTSGIAANLLWDNAEYVLGIDTKSEHFPFYGCFCDACDLIRKDLSKRQMRVDDQHIFFWDKAANELGHLNNDCGLEAVQAFFEKLDLKQLSEFLHWKEIKKTNPNISFRLHGQHDLVCQSHQVIAAVQEKSLEGGGEKQHCLITGDHHEVERLHPSIKGVWGAQSSGANIVSFNLDASESFGKKQGGNAPISKQAVFAYTTALNHLLRQDSPQRMQIGDTSTIFWAEEMTDFEQALPNMFGEPNQDDPDRNFRAVEQLFKSIHNGRYTGDDKNNRFYVLGLAPNAARIAIRFWSVSTVAELAEHIAKHFDDTKIVHSPKEMAYLPLFRLLVSTASLGKAENIPPNLAGETMRAILAGEPYPQTLLGAAVRRIKAEQHISYPRVALIKACLNRQKESTEEDIHVSLDENNTNTAYQLGRFFAVLEKIQEEANPGLNATIRDRYYGSASSSPVTVFSTLIKLSKHHLAKLSKGRAINIERLIGEIMTSIQDFPAHLTIADQGRFAIGYYHQRQELFTKKENKDVSND
ncbi:MAG: type I-C CRISPR-associated protein Cas8c/Csd1 [Mariprofundaceae bacterium]|nr:type I-C CRISPR-associated protein Cas8c/Csd1 [Mariprofundaceae bacterium]